MKKIFLIGLVGAGLNLSAPGAMYNFSGGLQNGSVVPAGSLNGWSDTINAGSVLPRAINSVTVTVDLSGGYNGDLYAYISHDGQIAMLLNRIGVGTSGGNGGNAFGNSGSGITVTFATGGANGDIHLAANGALTGTYAPDGRAVDPLSAPASFDAAGTAGLTTFDASNPNGTWTLFIADTVSGGPDFSVISWGMSIDAVPEPVNVALGIFGLWVVGGAVVRRTKRLRDYETARQHD
ncbi:MAG TPA: hypothetical protein VN829_08040 [Dongiaceae bacterium]|nr:hypothetical protein [Dongiaceae bacterium]